MSFSLIYAFLVVTVYVSNTCGLNNVVRASHQTSGKISNDASESSPKVSAVLLECPKELPNSPPPKQPCEQQLMVNIRVNPSFHVEKCEKYLILDEVYDPRKRAKAKIMSPYLIEISRGEPVMMYPLQFTKTIKSDEFIPQSEKVNCQNFLGTKKGNSVNRTPNNTETLTSKIVNLSGAESDPEQDSLNRVMDKITDAFAAAKSSLVNEDDEESSYTNQLKKSPNSFSSFQNSESSSHLKPAPTNFYTEYIADNSKKLQPFHQSYPSSESSDVSPKMIGNRYCTDDKRKRKDVKNPSGRSGQGQCMANVGVPEKLFKKLENCGKNVAQLGSIKFSENKHNQLEESGSGTEEKVETGNDEHQNLQRSAFVEREDEQNCDERLTDYELSPIYARDFLQQQAEIHPDMEDDRDEMSSGGYKGRSAIPRVRKFRKFRGGKKRGHQKKKQEKHARQDFENQQIKFTQLDEYDSDYDENPNQNSNREREQKKVLDGYRNFDDSEPTKEHNTRGDFENGERALVKNEIPSDLLENFEKIKIPAEGRQLFPGESEDGQYAEWAKKKGSGEKINYSSKERDYRVESEANKEANNHKRNYDEKNRYKEYKANKIENSDPQVELERSEVNINDNANYKPLEMPQYDYDEDNKQIVLIRNNKKYSNRNRVGYNSAKRLNFAPANVNSFGHKNAQLHKSNLREEGNQNDLKPSHSPMEGKRGKNFEAADHMKNNMNGLSKDDREFQKTILNNHKLVTGLKMDSNKNKYQENGYNFNYNDQSGRKIKYDEPISAKNDYYSSNLEKMESLSIPENRFKSSWNKNSNNDVNFNNKQDLEAQNMGIRFDVDEIIRQNYKMPVSLPSPDHAELLLNSEPQEFLPKRPPYSRIIGDPNLNIKDKLGVLDIIDAKNENANRAQNDVFNDIVNSYVILQTTPSIPIEALTINPKMLSVRRTSDNSKKKRSFIFYDDLEMRDTLMDNDYNFDDIDQRRRGQDREQSVSRHVQEDVSPCATCGGKGKKPIQKNPALHSQENACRCRDQPTLCICPDSRKKIRSISDAWYAVFNMSAPLPFLTTKLRIFRKRHNIWWKIVPSITLSSLSGIFANANLSILFSSHVDIFQLEKSLRLQNHQLLIPKDDRPIRQNIHVNHEVQEETPNLNSLSINPSNILAIENPKISDWNSVPISSYDQDPEEESESLSLEQKNKNRFARFAGNTIPCVPKPIKKPENQGSNLAKLCNGMNSIRTIAELGYFPTTMNLLEYCPNDKNRLCLNMLEDRVPAYNIKLKLPFRENSLIHRHLYKVSIARIVTDATTMSVLQVSVDLINKGLFAHEFAICVCNCPMANGGPKNRVKKKLIPFVGETITFLLPLILDASNKHKKFTCDVIIRDAGCGSNKHKSASSHQQSTRSSKKKYPGSSEKDNIVSIRSMAVEPDMRCFCIWDCKCHCVPKLETYVDCHICQKMYEKESVKAGLIACEAEEEICLKNFNDSDEEVALRGRFRWFVHNALILLGIMLALGFLKAVIGLASKKVNKWGYEYVQPTNNYEESSVCRRFFVNTFFFIVFPFLFWCKCFTPSEEDLLVASTEWQCSLVQDSRRSSEDDDYDNCGYKIGKFSDGEEDVILSQHFEQKNTKPGRRSSGGEDILNLDTHIKEWTMAFNDGVFDDDDDADEEANTKFVLQALVESRESLKKLLRNPGPHNLDVVTEEADPRIKRAEEFVQSLKTARIVYRSFDRPVGNVRNIPFGIRYCVQGFFLPSLGSEFEFVNYNPMAQYRCISADGTTLEILRPPIALCPQEFSRVYADPLDVLEAGDLSISPPPMTPCINITTMAAVASSVVKLASDQSSNGKSSTSSKAPRCNQGNTYYTTPQQAYRISTCEDDPSDVEMPSASQVALNISNMNEEMMNESLQQPIEDESIDLVDDRSIELISHHCDTIEE